MQCKWGHTLDWYGYVFYVYLRLLCVFWTKTEHVCFAADTEHRTFCIQQIFSKMALRWLRWDSWYFYLFCVQKVFSSLHKVQIEPLMADGLFWRCLYTFLGLDGALYLAVNGKVKSLSVFIQNILNCVPKTNKVFTGLEQDAKAELLKSSRTRITLVTIFSLHCHLARASGAWWQKLRDWGGASSLRPSGS